MTPSDPMRVVHHRAPDPGPDRILLVMLPGVGIEPEDFAAHGLVAAAQASGLPVDIAAARPELDLYLDGTIAGAVESAIVAPARQAGYRRIWLLGISLGGMGALLYAASALARVEGIILLAPFLGTPGIIAEVGRAGGLCAWQPGEIAAKDGERALLAWLKDHVAALPPRPRLYLGYARGDRFVAGHALLADHLPAERVVVVEGAHDWESWGRLWQLVLCKHPFAAAKD
jgi:pimeloyl-ACP methyl ester carboxylesterase